MVLRGYFDANATTPLLPRAKEVFLAALDRSWHNPSSLYHEAGAARLALEGAREHIATLLGLADPDRIVFTSSATEANNILLRHLAATLPANALLLTSQVEHPCLLEPANALLPGRVLHTTSNLEALRSLAHSHKPAFVSLMAANNETGVLHPWKETLDLCRDLGVPFHSDAAQWIGKMPLAALGECDWLTGSAHKFGGPKGAGFIVVPHDLPLLRGSLLGGPQEHGRRAGTENLPAILAMSTALSEAETLRPSCSPSPRDKFESLLRELIPGVTIVAENAPRLWNTSMFILPSFSNLKWLTRLSHIGFQVSTGSACSSGKGNPSHVMEAMGLSHDQMGRVLRASALWQTSLEDWLSLAHALHQSWQDLQTPATRHQRKVRL